MKSKLLLTLIVAFLTFSNSYASFPVQRSVKTVQNSEITTSNINEEVLSPITTVAGKDKWVGVAFWFFLGWPFAAHRWYYNKPVWANILFILTIGGLGIWAIIDLINILTDKWD